MALVLEMGGRGIPRFVGLSSIGSWSVMIPFYENFIQLISIIRMMCYNGKDMTVVFYGEVLIYAAVKWPSLKFPFAAVWRSKASSKEAFFLLVGSHGINC